MCKTVLSEQGYGSYVVHACCTLKSCVLVLDNLAEYTLLSMTIMATPCLWYVVGMKFEMSYVRFLQAPFVGRGRGTVGKCTGPKWSKMVIWNDHFGQSDLIPNRILAFARPRWTKMVHFGPFWPKEVHFGPFRSAHRTLAIPDFARAPLAIDENPVVYAFGRFCEISRRSIKREGIGLSPLWSISLWVAPNQVSQTLDRPPYREKTFSHSPIALFCFQGIAIFRHFQMGGVQMVFCEAQMKHP